MRSHVFPMCGPGFLNIDSDFSNNDSRSHIGLGEEIYRYNLELDEKSVVLFIQNDELKAISVYNFNQYSEFLNSIDEAKLDDILSNTESVAYTFQGGRFHSYRFAFANQRLSSGSAADKTVKTLLEENGVKRNHIPEGLIMCVGSKYDAESRTVNEGAIRLDTSFRVDQGAASDISGQNHVFGEGSGANSYAFENINVKSTKWTTLMWTGTRFVILGSNNWA